MKGVSPEQELWGYPDIFSIGDVLFSKCGGIGKMAGNPVFMQVYGVKRQGGIAGGITGRMKKADDADGVF